MAQKVDFKAVGDNGKAGPNDVTGGYLIRWQCTFIVANPEGQSFEPSRL